MRWISVVSAFFCFRQPAPGSPGAPIQIYVVICLFQVFHTACTDKKTSALEPENRTPSIPSLIRGWNPILFATKRPRFQFPLFKLIGAGAVS